MATSLETLGPLNFLEDRTLQQPRHIPSAPRYSAISGPTIFAGTFIGISLGVVAGLALACINPAGAKSTIENAFQAGTATSQSARLTQNQDFHPAAAIRQDANNTQLEAVASQPAQPQILPANRDAKSTTLNTMQASTGSAGVVHRTRMHRSVVVDKPAVEPIAKPLVASAPAEPTPAVLPAPLDQATSALADQEKPSSFYVEGFIKVVDYNATAGTIETSDGRTFAMGSTISYVSSIASEGILTNVHYRCGQNGNCVLNHPGMMALNVRRI